MQVGSESGPIVQVYEVTSALTVYIDDEVWTDALELPFYVSMSGIVYNPCFS